MAYEVSNDHVTDDVTWPRKVTRDPNTLRSQYLKNSDRYANGV